MTKRATSTLSIPQSLVPLPQSLLPLPQSPLLLPQPLLPLAQLLPRPEANVGAIVGGVVGGIALIVVSGLIGAFTILRCHKRFASSPSTYTAPETLMGKRPGAG